MATHLAAYYQSIDSSTNAPVATVVDDVLTRTASTRFLVPADYRFIRWAYAAGANILDARFQSPSLGVRRMDVIVVPRQRGGLTVDPVQPQIYIPRRPIPLAPQEELQFVASEDAAGASAVLGLVALSGDTLPDPPAGDIRTVRCVGSTTLTANAWTTVSVTPEFSLEPGTYALVDFIPISATCVAARALITGQVYRPGKLGFAATESVAVDFNDALYRQTGGYLMGTFTHLTIPQFQFLATAADTSEVVYMYVIKTG